MIKLFMNLFEESGYDSHKERVGFCDGEYCYIIFDKQGAVGYELIYDKQEEAWFIDSEEFGEEQISDADAYCLARDFLKLIHPLKTISYCVSKF